MSHISQFTGNKLGRSKMGRKGFYDEQMVQKIISAANNIILNTLEGKGKYKDVSPETIVELAARFSLRGIPQNIQLDSSESRYLEIVHKLEGLTTDELRNIINAPATSGDRALPPPAA